MVPAVVAKKANATSRRECPYCGLPTHGKAACASHLDLPKLDPLGAAPRSPLSEVELIRAHDLRGDAGDGRMPDKCRRRRHHNKPAQGRRQSLPWEA